MMVFGGVIKTKMVGRWIGNSPSQGGGFRSLTINLLLTTFLLPFSLAAVAPSIVDVSIPPLLEEGPHKGELLFVVTHDPDQKPENLTIPCKADAIPTPSYSWFKNGYHFHTERDNLTQVEGEGTLIFSDPQPEDEGEYQCVATNTAGQVFSDIVTVRRSITISFPKGEPRVVTANLGEPLSLKCSNPGGYPIPTVHWVLQRADGSLRSVSSERATVDEEGTLWFGAVSAEDASEDALYACAASSATSGRQLFVVEEEGAVALENEEPSAGDFISLSLPTEYRMGNWVYLNVTAPSSDTALDNFEIKPFLQHVSKSEWTVLWGEDLRLFCIYGGNPIPKVQWQRSDGLEIPTEKIGEFGKALIFTDIKDEDEGIYQCFAESELGRGDTHTFHVNVEAAPSFREKLKTVNQPLGESATFRCSASGEPTPTITWTFNGEPMKEKHEETLEYKYLESHHKGVIACNASNEHGYVYATAFLNVLSLPPEFTDVPKNASGFLGDKVTLFCKAYGAPDPVINWTKVLDSGEKIPILEDDERFRILDEKLVIRSLNTDTQGVYQCEAINKYGLVDTNVSVELIESTVVNIDNDSVMGRAGSTISIRCSVSVDQRLTADVTWLKDEIPVNINDPRLSIEEEDEEGDSSTDNYAEILTISNSQRNDSGVYACVSKTDEDEAEDFAILTIEDIPDTPHIENIECGSRVVLLHWKTGSENSASVIGYIVQAQTELTDKWEDIRNDIPSSSNSAKIDVTPGLTYSFRVTAQNRIGASEPSTPSEPCKTPGAPPDYNPANVSVQMEDSSTLLVTYNAIPPSKHHGADFRYEISWKLSEKESEEKGNDDDDNGHEETFVEDADDENRWSKLVVEDWEQTETRIDGLRAHTQYRIRVAAMNVHGAAPTPNDVLAYTEAGEPNATPTNLRVRRITSSSAIVFWVPVPNELVFGPLKGYEVDTWRDEEDSDGDGKEDDDEEDDGDNDDVLVVGRVSHAVLTGLEPFTTYRVRVRVVNEKYAGKYTEPIQFTTDEAASSEVENLEARSLTNTSLIVEWREPLKPRGTITGYLVRYQPLYEEERFDEDKDQDLAMVISCDGEERQVKLSDLEADTLYRISVLPRNTFGLGKGVFVERRTENVIPSIPISPMFSWDIIEKESDQLTTTVPSFIDRESDNGKDLHDNLYLNVILADTNGDGKIDKEDVIDTDNDGDIDNDDIIVADIDNDGDIDHDDIAAADRDGDGDVDQYDIGDEDGDGDFDVRDVVLADEDGDGIINARDDDEENVLLEDLDEDGDIDEDDVRDTDGDGIIKNEDLEMLDIDNDGDIDRDDLKAVDKDNDGDVDAADVLDLNENGRIDKEDLSVTDRDQDGDIDRIDYIHRSTFVGDTDGDGDVDSDDVLDIDGDGDIDRTDINVADINDDGDIDINDVYAADRDGDGDVDAADIGDDDGDGDIDGVDIINADKDQDGDIDSSDNNEEGTIFVDRDGDGDLDKNDVGDLNGDGDVDERDVAIIDVNDDGKIDRKDLSIIDKDGDGDVDRADVVDYNKNGKIDEKDLEIIDRDGDGDIDHKDIVNQHVYLKDVDHDGDIDLNDVLDLDEDGVVDKDDIDAADIDDDGDVDEDDVDAHDKDEDGDIDALDISDLDGDGRIDEDDLDVVDRDGDGDIDRHDYEIRKVFLSDNDNDGDVDKDDVLDTDGDGDIDEKDFAVADIDNDGDVDKDDLKAGDTDNDGDVDFMDVGDEDNDGDIDAQDVIKADKDGDGDIDAKDDNGESILLYDHNGNGHIDKGDVTDVDRDGDVDADDAAILDIDNDEDVDDNDLQKGDRDGDGDIDAADITDLDGDGDVDGNDIIASDRDGDGDIDAADYRKKDIILADTDGNGVVNSIDVLDTDGDGVLGDRDLAVADINNDGEVNEQDVIAGDRDGDGDVDIEDIGDQDGDGDVDADDVETADRDGDGDIDLADRGEGIDVKINWQPDFDNNSGSAFYIQYRPIGDEMWRRSAVEKKYLHQTLRGLDAQTAYEMRMVAVDGEFETPSNISIIGPFQQEGPVEQPTVGAVKEYGDPLMWTWFIVAVMVAVTMICIVFFSIWVYNKRLARVSELRTQLYEGYEPPSVIEKKEPDVETGHPETTEVEEPLTAEKQRQQMAALLRRQETVQSVDSFASHDDDFAEYGDETMALDLLNSINLITDTRQEGLTPKP